jgi:hypothetical protein
MMDSALDDPWSSEVDGVVCCALRAMGTLVDHLNDEVVFSSLMLIFSVTDDLIYATCN